MKILISAFACAPDQGSEPGVGWDWSLKIAQRHQVWVLLAQFQQPQVERWLATHPDCPVRFVFVPLPWHSDRVTGLRWQLNYTLWQWRAYRFARRLHEREHFDLCHHLTYASFRTPSFLPLLNCPFVWGPLGGGEQATLPFYGPGQIGWRNALNQHLRLASNYLSPRGPLVRWNARRAAVIVAQTPQTAARLPAWTQPKIKVFANSRPALDPGLFVSRPAPPNQELRLLTGGRLLCWKGGHLLLQALALARTELAPDRRIRLTFCGSGPFQRTLERLVQTHGLEEAVRFVAPLDRDAYLRSLGDYHLYVLPSFNDSASLAAVEALAAGLPVLGLDFGGVGHLIDDSVGVKIVAHDPGEAVRGMARAIGTFVGDPDLWERKSIAAQHLAARHCNWEHTLDFLDELYGRARASGPVETASLRTWARSR